MVIESVYDISVEREGHLYHANHAAPITVMGYRGYGMWNLGKN